MLIVTTFSCEIGRERLLEPDYKVIEVNHNFSNYMRNIRDENDIFVIKRRNLVTINVDKDGQTIIKDTPVADSLIVAELKKYIIPDPTNKEIPSTIQQEFEFSGRVTMHTNLLVLAKFSEELSYKKYSDIRNEIYTAYNEVRDAFSLKKFNKTYRELLNSSSEEDEFKRQEVAIIFPIRYKEDMNDL
jgi:hypothetical protein